MNNVVAYILGVLTLPVLFLLFVGVRWVWWYKILPHIVYWYTVTFHFEELLRHDLRMWMLYHQGSVE